ncbi:MAG: serine/threonine-protein kinase [Myxococcota bacterium]
MEIPSGRTSSIELARAYASSAPLGRGDVTEAFRVRTHRGETRVLKRLRPELGERPEIQTWFCEEAQRTLGFVHPGAVSLLSIERSSKGSPHVLTEHVPGKTAASVLAAELQRGRSLPLDLAIYIAGEVATVLASAHERAVPLIHSGVRPSNVMLTSRGEVRVLDFGIARPLVALGGGRSPRLWAYQSPEAVLGRPLEPRSDVFQLGLLLFECLTGKNLFMGGNPRLILEGERVPPSTFRPEIPAEIDTIVTAALAPEARHRPSSARVFAAALRSVARARGLSTDAASVEAYLAGEPRPQPGREPERRLPSFEGRPIWVAPMEIDADQPEEVTEKLPLLSLSQYMWDGETGQFAMPFAPPPVDTPAGSISLMFGDMSIEVAQGPRELFRAWRSGRGRPVKVAAPWSEWIDADRFATLSGIDALADDSAPLTEVAMVGDLRERSFLSVLAELARAKATGRLMVMDPTTPACTRRGVELVRGVPVYVSTNNPALELPELAVAHRWCGAEEVPDLLAEVARRQEPFLELLAKRKRMDLQKMGAEVILDRLADPLRATSGRFAFDRGSPPSSASTSFGSPLGFLLECARRAIPQEELRAWAEARVRAEMVPSPELARALRGPGLPPRLIALSAALASRPRLIDVVGEHPGDAGAIYLVACVFALAGLLAFKNTKTSLFPQ